MIHCKNCEINFNSNYCPNCGQKNSVGNLTLHEVMHEFWHGITHTDKGILNLLKSYFNKRILKSRKFLVLSA